MSKLNELFEIVYGSNINLSNIQETNKNKGYPYVSRTEKNNGISAYVEKQPNSIKLNPKHTLSVALGGTVLATFYQNKEYYSGRDIAYLNPKITMTKQEMIYYALCIKANKIKYSYGRQANRTLKNIELPDFDKIPSWVNEYKLGSIELIEKPNNISLDFSQCEYIYISELFNISRGKSKSISEMLLDTGETPIISSTEFNNGITGYTNYSPTFNKNQDEKCLTLAINGSVGACFFQNNPFIATVDVGILIPKEKTLLNRYTAIYFTTLLSKEIKSKFSYGRKVSLNHLNNTQLKFPIKNGEIDWQLIEDYIKNIESKYKINMISKH